MSDFERTYEFGPAGTGVLARAVMLSVTLTSSGDLKGELAVDYNPMPAAIRISGQGSERVEQIAPTDMPIGLVGYTDFTFPLMEVVRIELLSIAGNVVRSLSFDAAIESGTATPLFPPADAPAAAPPPVEAAPPVEAPPPAPPTPPPTSDHGSRFASPAPTYTAAAEPISDHGARAAQPVSDHGARAAAQPTSDHGARAAAQPVSDHGARAAAQPVSDHGARATPVSDHGGRRPLAPPSTPPLAHHPAFAHPAPPEAAAHPENPPSHFGTSLDEFDVDPDSPDAISMSRPGTVPNQEPDNNALPTGAAVFDPPMRRQAVKKKGAAWPPILGLDGKQLGAASASGAKVLTLSRAERQGEGAVIELLLEDEGLIAVLHIARLGEELAAVSPRRLTAVSPAQVTINVPEASGEIILVARDAYGEAFQDLITRVDIDAGQFAPFVPVPGVWKRYLLLREPLDWNKTNCASCREELDLTTAASWTTIESHEREALRAQFPLTPEARGLCAKCHEEYVTSNHLTHAVLQYFNWKRLFEIAVRGVFAYLGALAVRTAAGALLGRFLDVGFQGGVEDWLSFDVAGAAFAFLTAVLPWPVLVEQMVSGWRAIVRGRRPQGVAAIAVPVIVGAAIHFGMNDPADLPASYTALFFSLHWHLMALPGLGLAMGSVILFEQVVERSTRSRLLAQRKLLEAGKAGRLTPPLMRVSTRGEYEKALERAFIEGLGALEFQVFARPPGEQEFHMTRTVGPFRSSLMNLTFTDTSLHVLGRCAAYGYVIGATDVGKGLLIDPAQMELKVPMRLCIPVWAGGHVSEIYCVTRLRPTAEAEESMQLAELIALAAGRSLHRILIDNARPVGSTQH